MIDYKSGMVFIKKNRHQSDDDKNTHQIAFRDFLNVQYFDDQNELSIRIHDSQKPYIYPFSLETSTRTFTLYTKSKQERVLWYTGF